MCSHDYVSSSSCHGNLHFPSRRNRVRDRHLSLLSLPFDDLLSARDVIRLRMVGVPSQLSLHVLIFAKTCMHTATVVLYCHVSGLDLESKLSQKDSIAEALTGFN